MSVGHLTFIMSQYCSFSVCVIIFERAGFHDKIVGSVLVDFDSTRLAGPRQWESMWHLTMDQCIRTSSGEDGSSLAFAFVTSKMNIAFLMLMSNTFVGLPTLFKIFVGTSQA